MRDYFAEILIVIAYSGRTQAAILLGMIGFIIINLAGDYYLSHMQLSGTMAAFTDVFKAKLLHQYDKAAWGVLFSSWWSAAKFYRKDKKNLIAGYDLMSRGNLLRVWAKKTFTIKVN